MPPVAPPPLRGGFDDAAPPFVHLHDYPCDALDALIDQAARRFQLAPSWAAFEASTRDPINDFHPEVGALPHPAATLMERLRTEGARSIAKGPPWSTEQLHDAVTRGAHKSAKDHIPFLREEFTDMLQKGYWTLLPAHLLVGRVTNLRLSPLGVVPQRECRDRFICDYTFFGVNADTEATAPQEAMQFGRAFHRILARIYWADPTNGPVYLSKIDIADGFYHVGVLPADIPSLAVLFPMRPGEPPLIALPLTLPMGWRESPPFFCAVTETVTDLANDNVHRACAPHRLDVISETPPPSTLAATSGRHRPIEACRRANQRQPVAAWDVYVDDFVGVVQGNQ